MTRRTSSHGSRDRLTTPLNETLPSMRRPDRSGGRDPLVTPLTPGRRDRHR